MNIFKILANGHGTVSETNVSAFLGYLLDPNADHGIGYEFLNLFLEEVLSEKNTLDETDFKPYQYDYQVFFEQKFKETNNKKSEVIDICIVCYEIKNEGNSMSVMSDFISNNKEIKSVFLIENKIKGEPTKGQLSNQFLAFKDQFSEIKPDFNINNIHSVYITPETIKFNKEFNTNTIKIQNKTHLHWNNNYDKNNSIKKLLQEILIKEANYEIDPLNEYTKHTIKAFIQFINNDFKSIKEEKSERKHGLKDLHTTTKSLFDKYGDLLDSSSQNIVIQFEDYLNNKNYDGITFRHSKTHPLTVLYNNKKIFGLNRRGKKIVIDVLSKSQPILNDLEFKQEIILFHNNNPENGVRLKPYYYNIEEILEVFETVLNKINSINV